MSTEATEAPPALTAREREVAELIARGLGNKEIARAMGKPRPGRSWTAGYYLGRYLPGEWHDRGKVQHWPRAPRLLVCPRQPHHKRRRRKR